MRYKKNIIRIMLLIGIITGLFFVQQVHDRRTRFDNLINFTNENNLNVSYNYVNYFGTEDYDKANREEGLFVLFLAGFVVTCMWFLSMSFVLNKENEGIKKNERI